MNREQALIDLASIIALNPSELSYGEQTVDGLLTLNELDKMYLPEGSADKYSGSISLVYDDFDTLPQVKELVNIDGIDYRILKIVVDSYKVRIKLILRFESAQVIEVSA